jgi:hypothetical protein
MTIGNDDARIVNKLDASLTDEARVVLYDRHMFIVQATVLGLLENVSLRWCCCLVNKHSSLLQQVCFKSFPLGVNVVKLNFYLICKLRFPMLHTSGIFKD